MRQSFEIPGRLEGLNELIAKNRSGPSVGARHKREQQDIALWAIKAAHLKPMQAPVYARFTWVESSMRRDKDNIASAKKYIFDALVESGVIENDNWKWVDGFSDEFRLNRSNPRIIVELEDMNG